MGTTSAVSRGATAAGGVQTSNPWHHQPPATVVQPPSDREGGALQDLQQPVLSGNSAASSSSSSSLAAMATIHKDEDYGDLDMKAPPSHNSSTNSPVKSISPVTVGLSATNGPNPGAGTSGGGNNAGQGASKMSPHKRRNSNVTLEALPQSSMRYSFNVPPNAATISSMSAIGMSGASSDAVAPPAATTTSNAGVLRTTGMPMLYAQSSPTFGSSGVTDQQVGAATNVPPFSSSLTASRDSFADEVPSHQDKTSKESLAPILAPVLEDEDHQPEQMTTQSSHRGATDPSPDLNREVLVSSAATSVSAPQKATVHDGFDELMIEPIVEKLAPSPATVQTATAAAATGQRRTGNPTTTGNKTTSSAVASQQGARTTTVLTQRRHASGVSPTRRPRGHISTSMTEIVSSTDPHPGADMRYSYMGPSTSTTTATSLHNPHRSTEHVAPAPSSTSTRPVVDLKGSNHVPSASASSGFISPLKKTASPIKSASPMKSSVDRMRFSYAPNAEVGGSVSSSSMLSSIKHSTNFYAKRAEMQARKQAAAQGNLQGRKSYEDGAVAAVARKEEQTTLRQSNRASAPPSKEMQQQQGQNKQGERVGRGIGSHTQLNHQLPPDRHVQEYGNPLQAAERNEFEATSFLQQRESSSKVADTANHANKISLSGHDITSSTNPAATTTSMATNSPERRKRGQQAVQRSPSASAPSNELSPEDEGFRLYRNTKLVPTATNTRYSQEGGFLPSTPNELLPDTPNVLCGTTGEDDFVLGPSEEVFRYSMENLKKSTQLDPKDKRDTGINWTRSSPTKGLTTEQEASSIHASRNAADTYLSPGLPNHASISAGGRGRPGVDPPDPRITAREAPASAAFGQPLVHPQLQMKRDPPSMQEPESTRSFSPKRESGQGTDGVATASRAFQHQQSRSSLAFEQQRSQPRASASTGSEPSSSYSHPDNIPYHQMKRPFTPPVVPITSPDRAVEQNPGAYIEVMYDPLLGVYYDPATLKYYKLKD
ncbi:unnamed protein product [Amoebophrya sp. A120]|nr:unnamed protein product [Amoebophrya sp. A120]|eukprot:GSA120T00018499001.1